MIPPVRGNHRRATRPLRPAIEYAAKFSAQFVIVTRLRLGLFGLAELLPAALTDESTLALAARMRCEADPDSAFRPISRAVWTS